jgi:hypothetical protein
MNLPVQARGPLTEGFKNLTICGGWDCAPDQIGSKATTSKNKLVYDSALLQFGKLSLGSYALVLVARLELARSFRTTGF